MRNVARCSAHLVYEAPPAAEGAAVIQDMSNIPTLFPPALLTQPRKRPMECGRCGVVVLNKSESRELKKIECDMCLVPYHYVCANILRAPRHGWACEGCKIALG